jgi:thiol-disulfide isomerase/thioredoxin
MKKLFVAAACCVVLSALSLRRPVEAAPSIDGLWDAVVVANGIEIPFRFQILTNGREGQGFFFEGDRQIGSTSGSFADGVLKLEYDFLNTTLEVTLKGDELAGTYLNNRAGAKPQEVRMRRFTPAAAAGDNTPALAGNWEMRRNAEEATASRDTRTWTVFLRQSGAEVSGTILRVDGDTGTLVGHWQNGRLVLSHFAGERPNLFEARLNADGTLAVTLNGTAHYLVVRSGEARAKGIPDPPDPSRYTNVKEPTVPFHFAFPDLAGKMVSDTDPQLRGKVMILAIGGSWCPNCHDEAPFLQSLYRKYHGRGLEIVTLSFEEPEQYANPVRLRAFVRDFGLGYTVLLAGTLDDLHARLPQAVDLDAYPTTFFVGRDGLVKGVHAGFAAAATGSFNTQLKQDFTATIEKLLAQKPSAPRVASLQ